MFKQTLQNVTQLESWRREREAELTAGDTPRLIDPPFYPCTVVWFRVETPGMPPRIESDIVLAVENGPPPPISDERLINRAFIGGLLRASIDMWVIMEGKEALEWHGKPELFASTKARLRGLVARVDAAPSATRRGAAATATVWKMR